MVIFDDATKKGIEMFEERITIDPEIRHGKPVIKGTRVPVEVIFGVSGWWYGNTTDSSRIRNRKGRCAGSFSDAEVET